MTVIHTRSRTRKQALATQPVRQDRSHSPSIEEREQSVHALGVDKARRKSLTRATQIFPPTFESTRIELVPVVEGLSTSPEKKGYEQEISKKVSQQTDASTQVSLCRNCNSGKLWPNLKPYVMAFVLMILTLYCKEFVDLKVLKQYASSLKTPSTLLASLKLEEFVDKILNAAPTTINGS